MEDLKISITREQYRMILIKIGEVAESNVLVAATNIAHDEAISLTAAIEIALNGMNTIREIKRDRRSELKVVV